jgi:hypothetical protein
VPASSPSSALSHRMVMGAADVNLCKGALSIAVAVTLAVGGLVLARKRLKYDAFEAHHDVAVAIYTIAGTIAGTIYAVLLAFAVIIVWQAFTDTQSTVAQ